MLTSQSSSTQPTADDHAKIDDQLAHVNKEIYERNVELAIRNRTLGVLRKMYEIMNTSLGVVETAQKLIEAIVRELQFQEGFIALVDKNERTLRAIAVSQSEPMNEVVAMFGKPFEHLKISLDCLENFSVSSVLRNTPRMTNNLYDILLPLVDEETARIMAEKLHIKTSVIFPIVFAKDVLGVLVLGMDKHVGDLSRAERETIKELIDVVGIAIERAQIYADLKAANEQLELMDKLKDEFVSVTSHELRTPMTAIKSYLWLVLNGKAGSLEAKAKAYLNKVYISTDRLINLVNDMLDVSRIESGRIQLNLQAVDMIELANSVKDEFLAKAVERNMGLSVEAPEVLAKAFADREKIQQVLENLVGNAFKFTANGGIIGIHLTNGEGFIQVVVSDTGKGIPAEDVAKLFTKFGRLGNSLVSLAESGGTGLGLYICKQFIELHKGKIWVESEVDKGSRFIFTLPTARS
ncbi:GAF domain-containing sensor histidine kinase [Candidatus Curtissbacteria bacterium]|nr:GAF domain-containing sensor histidine kinase [Candidatus Curtissbacteria bacterium]